MLRASVLVVVLSLLALGARPAGAASRLELVDGVPVVQPQGLPVAAFAGSTWEGLDVDGAPVLQARRGGEPVGTVFLTHQLADMVGYSGKPLEILVAMAADGTVAATRLVDHHEPILLVGIPEQVLHAFVAQFVGQRIEPLLRANAAGTSPIVLDGVSGATVTALVADQVILTAGRRVAQATGLLARGRDGGARLAQTFAPMTWPQLLEAGLLQHTALSAAEVRGAGHEAEDAWLDLYVGVLNQPTLGINLLGEEAWRALQARHGGAPLLVLLNNGSYSFRGSGFVRGGIFDRLELTQGLEIVRFRDSDYTYQFGLALADAPHVAEKAIYAVRNPAFNPALPWELEVLVSERGFDTATSKKFLPHRLRFAMPDDYVEGGAGAFGDLSDSPSLAARIWRGKAVWIGLYVALWAVVGLTFAFKERVSRHRRRLQAFHIAVLVAAILLLGVGQKGQPSVVNIFTFVDVVRSGSGLGIFLTEPFLFVSWVAITVGTILWGRGPFCGWICPYGGLLEVLYFVRNQVLPRRWRRFYELPDRWHHRLKHLPYVTFAVLLTVSLFSLKLAEVLAELEPFKTTWLVGVGNRPWALALYWTWLLAMGLVTLRFFCRYLCPLGGYLAILSRFQVFKLPRRNFCTACNICAKGCSTRAIDGQGRIDSRHCFGCLECTNSMHDAAVCPPLRRADLWERFEAPGAAAAMPVRAGRGRAATPNQAAPGTIQIAAVEAKDA